MDALPGGTAGACVLRLSELAVPAGALAAAGAGVTTTLDSSCGAGVALSVVTAEVDALLVVGAAAVDEAFGGASGARTAGNGNSADDGMGAPNKAATSATTYTPTTAQTPMANRRNSFRRRPEGSSKTGLTDPGSTVSASSRSVWLIILPIRGDSLSDEQWIRNSAFQVGNSATEFRIRRFPPTAR
ncbi:hypothetical protein FPZ12_012585 [Amycolatopsis acidicola]|uniref:Uncharacterized protein n=1 Tax=Amycolatopsis acidicola TaxID=2596893 RepID=A0A5N0V973_9PSEU|nr:hypothetical protein [Amycolatopsis acidicola]KAA9162068.1 hypothetical protein FPZ12_012585 [Amycolatopsis acidicola]